MTQPQVPHVVRRYENNEWETAVDEYGGGGGAAGGALQLVSGILTAAEIRSCSANPVQVLPGVPGQAYVFLGAGWFITAGTTGHTNTNNADLAFSSGSAGDAQANLGFLIALTGSKVVLTRPAGGWGTTSDATNSSDTLAAHAGKGVVLSVWADITGTGDLDLHYTVSYFLMPTT